MHESVKQTVQPFKDTWSTLRWVSPGHTEQVNGTVVVQLLSVDHGG